MIDGADLRAFPLLERKRRLCAAVKDHTSVLFADQVEDGAAFFRLICEQDLEGVVAKRRDAAYGVDWYKIINPNYSQRIGRDELFEKRVAGSARR